LRVLASDDLADAAAVPLGIEAARLPTARSCLLSDETGGLRAIVELAGDAASVDRDAEHLAKSGLRLTTPALRDAAATRRYAGLPGSLRFVVSSLPTALEPCVALLRPTGAELLVLPGLGLVCARAPASSADALFDAAAGAAQQGLGRFLCELAPPEAKRGRDVFGAPRPEVVLGHALKARFDLAEVLNRGRGAGGI
jgi:hypothetical protein